MFLTKIQNIKLKINIIILLSLCCWYVIKLYICVRNNTNPLKIQIMKTQEKLTVGQKVARSEGNFLYRIGIVQKVNDLYDLALIQFDDNTPARWNAFRNLSIVTKA
jgi:hypothetical protein